VGPKANPVLTVISGNSFSLKIGLMPFFIISSTAAEQFNAFLQAFISS